MDLEKLTVDLYKELKAKSEEYAVEEKNATNDSNRLISKGKKEAYSYASRKLRLNFEWLDVDF